MFYYFLVVSDYLIDFIKFFSFYEWVILFKGLYFRFCPSSTFIPKIYAFHYLKGFSLFKRFLEIPDWELWLPVTGSSSRTRRCCTKLLGVSIQKRCFKLVLNDYENNYATLLKKNNTTTMKSKRLGTLVTDIFKTINNINPSFMKDTFTSKRVPKVRPYNILITLLTVVKSLTSITKFKENAAISTK